MYPVCFDRILPTSPPVPPISTSPLPIYYSLIKKKKSKSSCAA